MDTTSLSIEEIILEETGTTVNRGSRLDAIFEDSLDFIELLMLVERKAGIKLSNKVVMKLETVGDLIDACNISN